MRTPECMISIWRCAFGVQVGFVMIVYFVHTHTCIHVHTLTGVHALRFWGKLKPHAPGWLHAHAQIFFSLTVNFAFCI